MRCNKFRITNWRLSKVPDMLQMALTNIFFWNKIFFFDLNSAQSCFYNKSAALWCKFHWNFDLYFNENCFHVSYWKLTNNGPSTGQASNNQQIITLINSDPVQW